MGTGANTGQHPVYQCSDNVVGLYSKHCHFVALHKPVDS